MTFTQLGASSPIMSKRKILLFAVLAVCLLAILGTGGYLYFRSLSSGDPEYDIAIKNLTRTFTEVADEVKGGYIDAARITLETRAREATNPIERGTLLLTLAQITLSTDVASGVAEYKDIANDETLPPGLRAGALMGLTLAHYQNSVDRNTLTQAIFTGEEPYSTSLADMSAHAEEAAYAGLMSYAEDLYPTAFANAYLAHYWATEMFNDTSLDVVTTEAYNNAYTYTERTLWLLEHTTSSANDPSTPIATALLGIAEVYVSLETSSDTQAGVAHIKEGTSALSKITGNLRSQYTNTSPTGDSLQNEADPMQHALWRDILSAAVGVMPASEQTAVQLADLYAAFLSSDAGSSERTNITTSSDITPFINQLKNISPALQDALQHSL